jgi:dihydroorotate dehydrogenase (NAD+) catalytic subunit
VSGTTTGGISGPAIRPMAVRMVWQVANAVDLPVIGMGGISNANDALEFFLAGATAVAVGTANFTHPTTMTEIISDLEIYLEENEIGNISELTGALEAGALVITEPSR